jgi:hypothetical protein
MVNPNEMGMLNPTHVTEEVNDVYAPHFTFGFHSCSLSSSCSSAVVAAATACCTNTTNNSNRNPLLFRQSLSLINQQFSKYNIIEEKKERERERSLSLCRPATQKAEKKTYSSCLIYN